MNDYLKTFDARGHLYNDAMATCPHARDAELCALLDRARMVPGQVIMDAPAGGGYVADGVYERLEGEVELICIEPSAKFAQAISSSYRIYNCSVHDVPLQSDGVDCILSLAGLHHVPERRPIYTEWFRLLKGGG